MHEVIGFLIIDLIVVLWSLQTCFTLFDLLRSVQILWGHEPYSYLEIVSLIIRRAFYFLSIIRLVYWRHLHHRQGGSRWLPFKHYPLRLNLRARILHLERVILLHDGTVDIRLRNRPHVGSDFPLPRNSFHCEGR